MKEDVSKQNTQEKIDLLSLKKKIEENIGSDISFCEGLRQAFTKLDYDETLRQTRSPNPLVKPKEWNKVLTAIDERLKTLSEQDGLTMEYYPCAPQPLMKCMIDFLWRFGYSTKHLAQTEFVNSLMLLFHYEDWETTAKTLQIMDFFLKRSNISALSFPAYYENENIRSLANLAAGYNLKSNTKMSYTTALCDPILEVLFQYMAVSPEDEVGVPYLHTINLSFLKGNPASAQELVQDILKKSKIPKEFIPQLWHKVRLAKGMNDRESKFQAVLSSILALKIILFEVRDVTLLKSIIAEIELKTTLLPDLIQLLRCPKAPTQLQKEALEICNLLLYNRSKYRAELYDIGTELEEEVKRLLGFNVSTNGLILKMMRDCTGLRIDESVRLMMPMGGLEVLSIETAAHPEFQAALLSLLGNGLKQIPKKEFNRSFLNGVKACIINMLQLPMNEKVYHFRLLVTDLAIGILANSSISQSIDQDTSDVNRIIGRLNFELELIGNKTETLFYPDLPTYTQYSKQTKLKDHQQLINSLANLLANNIVESQRRDELFLGDVGLDDEAGFPNGIRHFFDRRARISEREENDPIIREARRRFGRETDSIRQPAEPDFIGRESVSRRIFDSRFIEIIQNAATTYSKFLSVEHYAPVIYSILLLIQSAMKDIPPFASELSKSELIKDLVTNLSDNIVPSPNYFKYTLTFLSTIQLNDQAKTLVKSSEIMKKLVKTLIVPEYQKYFPYAEQGYKLKEEAELILEIITQDDSIRSDVIHSIQTNFRALNEITKTIISNCNLRMLQGVFPVKKKSEEDQLKKKIRNHRKAISIFFNLICSWVQPRSRNYRKAEKFLFQLNTNNVFMNEIIMGSKLSGFLKMIDKMEITKTWTIIDLTNILRFYSGDDNPFRSLPENTENVIINHLEEVRSYFRKTVKFTSIPLIEYLSGRISLPPQMEIVKNFPQEDQLFFALKSLQWFGKIIQNISKRNLLKHSDVFIFIHHMHIYLIKGIIDLSASKGILQKCNYNNLENISQNAYSRVLSEVSNELLTPIQKFLDKIYYNLKSWISRATVQVRTEYHVYESRSSNQNCFRDMGKHSALLICEIQKIILDMVPAQDLNPENIEHCEIQLFYMLFLAKDLFDLIKKDYFSIYQVYELFREKSFAKIVIIYQKAVDYLIAIQHTGTHKKLKKLFKILILILTNFLTEFVQSCKLKKIMKQSANGMELDVKQIGFSNKEDLFASMMTYAMEILLYKTHYHEYDSAIRFLSECVKPAFKILLETLQQFSGKDSVFQKLSERGEDSGNRRPRRPIPIPRRLVNELTNMGFQTQLAEQALLEVNLDMSAAVNNLLKRREENEKSLMTINPKSSPVPEGIEMRKIEIKNIQVEIDKWISLIFFKLYEGLYSIGAYKCKYLMYFLTTTQSSKLEFKVNQAFEFFLNELQTLVFCIEFTYEFTPIPNEEFPIKELADLPMTNKLKKNISKYTNLCGITEESYLVLQKMETLISMMTTFVRLSPNNELIKLMCDNKISECLIFILGKLMTKEMILPGHRLFSKILILLSMIFKETYQQIQSELIDEKMQSLIGKELEAKSITHSLPAETEIRKLLEFLCQLLDNERALSELLHKINKKNGEIIGTETITIIILLLTHLTRDFKNARVVATSGIFERLLKINMINENKEIPIGLVSELTFNLLESPEMLEKFMERIISRVLWSNIKAKPAGLPTAEDLLTMQQESAIDIDRFLKGLGFLMFRNSYIFFGVCQKICMLRKVLERDEKGVMSSKLYISLRTEQILKLSKELEANSVTVDESLKECQSLLATSHPQVITDLLLRLRLNSSLDILPSTEETKMLSEGQILQILVNIFRVYPESLVVLITFTNEKIYPTELIEILLQYVFPRNFIQKNNGKNEVTANNEWKECITSFIKFLTFENPKLHNSVQKVLFQEIRKIVVTKILKIFSTINAKAKIMKSNYFDIKTLALAYSTLCVCQGLLLCPETSVLLPRDNEYLILREMLEHKKSLLKECSRLLQHCNLHSANSILIVNCVSNIMERITRFNRLRKQETSIREEELPPEKEEEMEPHPEEEPPIDPNISVEDHPMQIEAQPEQEESEEEIPDLNIEDQQENIPEPMQMEESDSSSLSSSELSFSSSINEGENIEEEERKSLHDEMNPREFPMPEIIENESFGFSPRIRFLNMIIRRHQEELNELRRAQAARKKDKHSNGLDSVQVQISGIPLDNYETTTVFRGMSAIYEIEEDSLINSRVVKLLKGEVLGEEEILPQSPRKPQHLDPFEDSDNEDQIEFELPSLPLFGYTTDKQKITELLKNQIIGGLETYVVQPEIPKPEEQIIMLTEKMEDIHPESKIEEEMKEQKEEEKKSEEEDLVRQRRIEVERLVPGLNIGNNREVLLQIDIEVLRSLPIDMRSQAVQQLMALTPSGVPPAPSSSDMDMATFLATLQDDNVRDEILLTAPQEILSTLTAELQSRASFLRRRNPMDELMERGRDPQELSRPRVPPSQDPLETALMVVSKGDIAEKEIIQALHVQINNLGEETIEWFIRLLYLNVRERIPLNSLLFNICSSKKYLYKTLNALIFILGNHNQIEKYFQSTAITFSSENVQETKLVDTVFPPTSLYQGMEYNHLTYSIISLRILFLLSSFLRSTSVSKYFFLDGSDMMTLPKRKNEFGSMKKLREKLEIPTQEKPTAPLSLLLSVVQNNDIFRKSERHLEAATYFISELFLRYERLIKDHPTKADIWVIPEENVKQIIQMFYFEVMQKKTCDKLGDILQKLSTGKDAAVILLRELDFLLQEVSKQASIEWGKQIKQLEIGHTRKEIEIGTQAEDSRIEIKFGMIMKLLKKIADGHLINGVEDSNYAISRLYISEGDVIDELSLEIKQKDSTSLSPKELHSLQVRDHIKAMLKSDFLLDAFSNLTELMAVISRKTLISESTSSKSQLLLKLLPSIESLIIAYDFYFKNLAEAQELMGEIRRLREENPEKREALGKTLKRAYIFYKFHDKNHQSFNNLIRHMPKDSYQTIIKPFVLRFPTLLDFENKRMYFISELRTSQFEDMSNYKLTVRRDNIFNDTYAALAGLSVNKIKSKFKVHFRDEAAVDAGGVTKEWYITLSRAMFNPIIGLFKKSAHGNTYQPDPKSIIEPNHLNYFKFIGRIIGKALREGQYLECYFTRALYKTLVNQPLTIQDMEDYDPELYKSLVWLKENDAELIDSTFVYTMDYFGKEVTKELVENGENIRVTNENKHQFIMKMCKAKLYQEIQPQLDALLKGINELIPKSLLSVFDYREIELLISGLPDIDLADLKANTEYNGYTDKSKVIKWFWETLEIFSSQERAAFLQFVTGTSKVPLDGFRNLAGPSGAQRFNIQRVHKDPYRLPTAHTCFNQLDLPEYPTKEILHERLLKAIKEGGDFFGMIQDCPTHLC